MSEERRRLESANIGRLPWRQWGPYLAERRWGTVREDYSAAGTPWEYFPHDHARSRAYRWGEDGIAGVSDDEQRLCLALGLWNGRDPIIKERFFGVSGKEGNHGEDAKELYYYLDNTPTHSYMKMLYKYPQAEYPYARLVEENRRRGPTEPELELIDTGLFDDDRYFDVLVEYAKAAPEDLLMRVTAHNRGSDPATLHLLLQLWFRNTWSWTPGAPRPRLVARGPSGVTAEHLTLGRLHAHADNEPRWLFCDNDTNQWRLFGVDNAGRSVKDAFHELLVHGSSALLREDGEGTKCAAHYARTVAGGSSVTVRLRLSRAAGGDPFDDFELVLERRRAEADEFYAELQREIADPESRLVQRQALAGMLWSKQLYEFDVTRWLDGDEMPPSPPQARRHGRNRDWRHLHHADVVSMPDKWEYPWYAAWDLAFHTIPLALVDCGLAKEQLLLLTREWVLHPSGQLPAYEWAFGDANPPVHGFAAWRVYKIDRKRQGGDGDREFLERIFHKLLLNFTRWVNRKDAHGLNLFQGGFLGLDNIGVFDRSGKLPDGHHIEQADGTSWMAMYSLNLMRIALELAHDNPVYEDLATKFFEHFLYIAGAMRNMGGEGIDLWDEEDEFFYDVLHAEDGPHGARPLKVRSLVGLTPLFAVETLEPELLKRTPRFAARLEWFLANRPDLAGLVSRWQEPKLGERRLLSLLRGHRMKCLLRRMLDEAEFLSPYGVRALSRYHLEHPYRARLGGTEYTVGYEPGDSASGLFGGNSNWRGPVWVPMNFLIIESLQKFHHYYGDDFKVEHPTGSGRLLTLAEIARDLSTRLKSLFLRDEHGRRPCLGEHEKLQQDPFFRDHLLFHEYFHGDNGRGLGASHQTGWTGLIAKLLAP